MLKDYGNYIAKLDIPRKKTILITGGNSGVGFAVMYQLASLGWNLIFAVRSLEKGHVAADRIHARYPDVAINIVYLDLSIKDSVDVFIKRVAKEKWDIDVFYCNAGVYRVPFSLTDQGLELTAQTNFVANYWLYEGLKAYLRTVGHPVRFILTSSIVARFETFSKEDFVGGKKYNKNKAYMRSKVAVNKLFLYLKDDCLGTNILPLMVHPGITYTPLIEKAYAGRRFKIAAKRFARAFFHKPEKAALSTLRLLKDDVVSPCFCGPRGIGHLSGYPKIYPLYERNLKDYKQTIADVKALGD